jgi:hypothetical protein
MKSRKGQITLNETKEPVTSLLDALEFTFRVTTCYAQTKGMYPRISAAPVLMLHFESRIQTLE